MNRRDKRAKGRTQARQPTPFPRSRPQTSIQATTASGADAPAERAEHLTQVFARAHEAHQRGDLEAAERLYSEVLAGAPGHGASAHLLGVVFAQTGRLAEGEAQIRKALALKADDPDALSNLGRVLHDLGRLEEAERTLNRAIEINPALPGAYANLARLLRDRRQGEAALAIYRKVLELNPRFPNAWYDMGAALRELGRMEDALAAYRKAVEQQPTSAEAWNNLGATLRDTGRAEEALDACRRALELRPATPEAYNNIGDALHMLGREAESVEACRKAIELRPSFPEPHANLGNALQNLGKPDEAIAMYQRAIELRPTFHQAYTNLGALLHNLFRDEEAAAACRRAIELRPDLPEGWNNLAAALGALARPEEALEASRRAIAIRPGYARSHVNLGVILQEMGRADEARAAVETALSLDPRSAKAWSVRSEMKKFALGDPDLRTMEDLLATADERRLPAQDRMSLRFALGKAWMDVGDPGKAMAHLAAGNRMKRAAVPFDPAADVANHAAVTQVFTPVLMERLGGGGDPSDMPVFVVGMPRSGTTLVEQILASHSKVHGGGELNALGEVLTEASGRGEFSPGYPQFMLELTRERVTRLGAAYVRRVAALSGGKPRVVDKKPGNVRYAGLIRLIAPNARIIHCRRDPVDTCLSCYVQNFVGRQDFSYDLKELGLRYRAYDALTQHWRRLMPPDRYMEVQYEDVVDDLEGQARRLVDFLGLEWEVACLAFHQTKRPVRTASVNQVRQPIYRGSVRRWKPYEPYLGPLLEELGAPRG